MAERMCDWDMGTWGDTRICGRPAKYEVTRPWFAPDPVRPVCGIHVRTARKWNYTVTDIKA